MTDTLQHNVPASDPVIEKLDRIIRILEGYNDGKNSRQPGIVERVEWLERIVASCTAFFLAIATVVSGAWGLLFWGPAAHK